MREIDLMRVDPYETVEKSDDSRPIGALQGGGDDGGGGPIDAVVLKLEKAEMSAGRRRRGRPPRTEAKTKGPPPLPSLSRKRREDEDVCFICFDGGSLVLCDRRGCPKVYHPACIKRDESFFRSRGKWNCGWHICSSCQKDSYYMCYTCPYSVCKRCVKTADFSSVRGSKGLCGICLKTILLIEKADQEDKEKVQVDFDDQSSWEYLFKIYWLGLKEKLSLSLDELIKAKNPWKRASTQPSVGKPFRELCDHSDGNFCRSDNSYCNLVGNHAKKRKYKGTVQFPDGTKWATNELLEFVVHMKNGDTSALSRYDVQTLVMEYIKRNNLLDPLQNSQIICDSKLMSLFGKERVGLFEMLKLLDSHFLDQENCSSVNSFSWGGIEPVPFKMEADRNFERFSISAPTGSGCSYQAVRSEPSVTFFNELPPTHASGVTEPLGAIDTNRIWHYRDPTGKIQGPFSMSQLRQWSTTGHFPTDLRIWRISEMQDDSILLTDALAGHCHRVSTLQNSALPVKEVKDFSNDSSLSVNVNAAQLENKRLDVSPNSVCTEASIISSNNSVITGTSIASNKIADSPNYSVPSSERQTGCSLSLWDKPKDDNQLPGQHHVSCSLSLAMFPGSSSGTVTNEESHGFARRNGGRNDANINPEKNLSNQNDVNSGLTTEKQVDTRGNSNQSCGQNWKFTPIGSSSTIWDSATGYDSFADAFNTSKLIQEIDFLDLPSPTLKPSFVSTASDWQPIVADPNECDESVSDLLAEVEAMESLKGLPSPTSTFRSVGALTRLSENDYFSPTEGCSPALDTSKGDAMSSTNNLQMPSQSTAMDY